MPSTPHPWAQLSPRVADRLRPGLSPAVDAVILAIDRELPAFRGGLDGTLGRAIREGVEVALSRFLDLLGTNSPALDDRSRAVYAGLGEGEGRRGRPMDALLAAYRVGARVTWAQFADAVRDDLPTGELVALAEAIFAYIDELSAASAVGHAHQQAAEAGHRDLLRARLGEALLDGTAGSQPGRLRELADRAGWPLPARLVVAVVPVVPGQAATPRQLPDALLLVAEHELVALIPDPQGRRAAIAAGLGSTPVFLGTTRPPEQAPTSLAHARAVRQLVDAGRIPVASLLAADDHLPELLLDAAPTVRADLAARVLAPLDAVPTPRRATLESTAAAWLAHQGDRAAVARALGVHPHTVTYRMAQVSGLLGDQLGSPRGRLELTLALSGGPAGARLADPTADPG